MPEASEQRPTVQETAAPAKRSGRGRRRTLLTIWRSRMLLFFAVFGPGFITANVDNDPGGILVYSQAVAKFGYLLLWTLIPTTVALIVVQEMAARMGAVTGKGLSDLIREEFGFRWTFFAMLILGIADFANIVAEFAGLASGMHIFGVSKFISVPIGALLIWLLILRGRYRPVERILILLSLIYISYLFSAVLARPSWHAAFVYTAIPTWGHSYDYFVMVLGIIGTTIAPWMQFYLQASIVEKGIGKQEYSLSRWDVIIGCIITDVVAFFIIVACAATLYRSGMHDFNSAADAAIALKPLAGRYAYLLFAVGLINAALLSAAILPLATAYNICEGLGFESGINRRFSEAKVFYTLYTLLIAFGAGAVLLLRTDKQLIEVLFFSQVANGVLLPFLLIFMLILINRKEVMGEYRNRPLTNVLAWGTSLCIIVLTAMTLFV